ncbi:uracil-DNA glycosylase [uncultured Desulfuromonas sp.]|uniref:uracil-DNA glycosylase n=1 Tax=uncultured Desulfuromonas sp. TaxID=181013 RepID=UPI002AAB6FEB|nr:uracil-DNA glycosylase [uncultured Desulfuromonas sp.]
MPQSFDRTMHEMLSQTRAVLTELQSLGVDELYLEDSGEVLPLCHEQPQCQTGRCDCRQPSLEEIRQDLGECQRCGLAQGRKSIVFGSGNPHAELVFVGEGPGRDEDEQGVPFVGEAGRLLERILFAMGYEREQVYICNVVKCRPPQNRNPQPDEIAACEPFLKQQLASLKPRVIVALGKFATQTLLQQQTPISRLRGNWAEYQGIALMPTYHPAYLLRNPGGKRDVWEDMKAVMSRLAQEDSP